MVIQRETNGRSRLGGFALNDVHCVDSLEALRALPDNCVDLMVASPPYDELRDYKEVFK